jgi:tripartite-type tricarboxylate transporter receptor subunit TctC
MRRQQEIMSSPRIPCLSVIFVALLPLAPANADSVADFYKGKTVTVITSTGAGGPFDATARLVARHMQRHIPGQPTMIVKNMPGGGHMLATNHMYNQADKDGTVIALVNNSVPLHQALGGKGVRFDARRFNWIGSTGISNLLTVSWHNSGFKSIDDVLQRELVTGATGIGSGTFIYPNAMNVVLGTKFKIVMGYKSTAELDIAMERGEVQARAGASYIGIQHWVTDKKVNVLFQTGAEREKDLPDVPLMSELAKTDDQRQILTLISAPPAIGRPFFTTPDVPAERVAALRKAFTDMLKDKAFLVEAKHVNVDITPLAGEKVAAIVTQMINTPQALLDQARVALEPPKAK